MSDIEQEPPSRAEKFALIEAAVKVIEPNVANNTAAWNTWNNLASSETFVRAILTTHHAQSASPASHADVADRIAAHATWAIDETPGRIAADLLAAFDIRVRAD